MRIRGVRAALWAMAFVVLAGCGTGATDPRTQGRDDTPPATNATMTVVTTGGFLPAYEAAGQPPELYLARGRVYAPGPVPAMYPGPALRPVLSAPVSGDTARTVVAALRRAGVGTRADWGLPSVTDVGTTRITLHDDNGDATASIYALSFTEQPPGDAVPADARAARQAVNAALEPLRNAAMTGKPYEPEAYLALAWRGSPGLPQDMPAPRKVSWPGPRLASGMPLNRVWRCVEVAGDDLTYALPAMRQATAITPWVDGGVTYTLRFQPLLPGQTGCAAATFPT